MLLPNAPYFRIITYNIQNAAYFSFQLYLLSICNVSVCSHVIQYYEDPMLYIHTQYYGFIGLYPHMCCLYQYSISSAISFSSIPFHSLLHSSLIAHYNTTNFSSVFFSAAVFAGLWYCSTVF